MKKLRQIVVFFNREWVGEIIGRRRSEVFTGCNKRGERDADNIFHFFDYWGESNIAVDSPVEEVGIDRNRFFAIFKSACRQL